MQNRCSMTSRAFSLLLEFPQQREDNFLYADKAIVIAEYWTDGHTFNVSNFDILRISL